MKRDDRDILYQVITWAARTAMKHKGDGMGFVRVAHFLAKVGLEMEKMVIGNH